MIKLHATRGELKKALTTYLQSYTLDQLAVMTKRSKEWLQMILDTKANEVDEFVKE